MPESTPESPEYVTDYIVEEVSEWEEGGPSVWYAISPREDSTGRREARAHAEAIGDSVRTAVYRLHDTEGHLLYVGISAKPPRRWVQHASAKPWWPQVAALYLEWCDSRTEARAVEADAIRTQRPVHNIVHNRASDTKAGTRSHFVRVTHISERPAHWIN